MEIHYENLELIPELLEKIDTVLKNVSNIEILLKPDLNLTKPTDVSKFLKVSKQTVYNYINDGTFKEGIHYHKTLNKKNGNIVFVESAVIRFKESL